MTTFDPRHGNFEDPSSRYDRQQPGETRGPTPKQGINEPSSAKYSSNQKNQKIEMLSERIFSKNSAESIDNISVLLRQIKKDPGSADVTITTTGPNNKHTSYRFGQKNNSNQNFSDIFEHLNDIVAVHNHKNNATYHRAGASTQHLQNQHPTATLVQVSDEEWTGFCTALTESFKNAKSQDKKEVSHKQQERTLSQGATAQPKSSSAVQDAAKKEKAEKERAANKESMAAAQKAGQGSFSELKKMEEKERAKNYVTEERDQKRSEIREERDFKK